MTCITRRRSQWRFSTGVCPMKRLCIRCWQKSKPQMVPDGFNTMTEINPPIEFEFQRIRDGLGIPRDFSEEVIAEAESAAERDPLSPESASRYAGMQEVPFVTIDPPESMDLDQAFFATKQGDGY